MKRRKRRDFKIRANEWFKKIEIKCAKEYINDYYFSEFQSTPDLNLKEDREINLAYTESDEGVPKQVTTIINKKEIYTYEDGVKVKTLTMGKAHYLNFLSSMDFDWLMHWI